MAAKLEPGYYVVIFEIDEKGNRREEKRLGPYASDRIAEKADDGVNRNLNHDRFFTLTEKV